MEITLEHVLVFLLFVFLVRFIMCNCGCNRLVEGAKGHTTTPGGGPSAGGPVVGGDGPSVGGGGPPPASKCGTFQCTEGKIPNVANAGIVLDGLTEAKKKNTCCMDPPSDGELKCSQFTCPDDMVHRQLNLHSPITGMTQDDKKERCCIDWKSSDFHIDARPLCRGTTYLKQCGDRKSNCSNFYTTADAKDEFVTCGKGVFTCQQGDYFTYGDDCKAQPCLENNGVNCVNILGLEMDLKNELEKIWYTITVDLSRPTVYEKYARTTSENKPIQQTVTEDQKTILDNLYEIGIYNITMIRIKGNTYRVDIRSIIQGATYVVTDLQGKYSMFSEVTKGEAKEGSQVTSSYKRLEFVRRVH
jgi:hypothetical protein